MKRMSFHIYRWYLRMENLILAVECVEEDLHLHMFVSGVSVSESLEYFSCQLLLYTLEWFGGFLLFIA